MPTPRKTTALAFNRRWNAIVDRCRIAWEKYDLAKLAIEAKKFNDLLAEMDDGAIKLAGKK